MEKAVIYARFSSHNQREESIDGQIRECKAYAKSQHLSIVNAYIDRAISGKTDNRPEFQRMIADAADGGFSFVIVYSLDRFSRDRYDAAVYKRKLKQCGVKVLSAKESISNDPTGILVESLLEGLAEYYSAELAQKIKRGMTENALKGKWASGYAPFGYRVNKATRQLELDPATAPTAKKIFIDYAKGAQIKDIAQKLNDGGFKTAKGNPFNKNSFRAMFNNKVYIGKFKWADVEIENGVPALIDIKTFEECQQRQIATKHTIKGVGNVRTSALYILSTKLFCGLCGAPMTGISGTSRNGTLIRYYTCSAKHKKTAQCTTKNFNANYLENIIAQKIIDTIKNKKLLDKIIDRIVAISEEDSDTSRLEMLQKEKEKVDKRASKILDDYLESEDITMDAIRGKLTELDERSKELKFAIESEKQRTKQIVFNRDAVEFFIRKYIQQAEENEDKNAQEIIIDAFLRKATLTKEKDGSYSILLTLNITPEPPNPSNRAHSKDNGSGSQLFSLVDSSRIDANHEIYMDNECNIYTTIYLA